MSKSVKTTEVQYEYFLLQEHAIKPACTYIHKDFPFPINLKSEEDVQMTINVKNSTQPPREVTVISHTKVQTPNGKPFMEYLYEDCKKTQLIGRRVKQ